MRPAPSRVAWLALAAFAAAVTARFVLVASSAFTYNEATYVELAGHPWTSSYYPDDVFLRHPPLAFAVLWAWTGLFGTSEWVVRLPSLAACLAAGGLLWIAVGSWRGWGAAAVAALVLASAFPVHAYGLQATMYPYAFLALAAALHAASRSNPRGEVAWLSAFALTHLFGFLFLALSVWRHRALGRRVWAWAAPAVGWLVLSIPVAALANPEGDVMRLGPLGQFLRGGATAAEVATGGWQVHLAVGALALLSIHPILLARAVGPGRPRPDWAVALGLLAVYFFLGAPYPRYALLALPVSLVAGLLALPGVERARTLTAVLAVAALSLPAGFLYLAEGPDPRAEGDVPGTQAWDDAVALLPQDSARIATSGPTATAYYLQGAGFRVVERDEAPYRIGLDGPRLIEVLRVDRQDEAVAADADAWIVPTHWDSAPDLSALGASSCGVAAGLDVYALSC